MKKNMTPLIAIAFVVAIISTGLFYSLFASRLSRSADDLPRQRLVVAAHKIARGAVLDAADVRVAEIRGDTGFGSSFTKPEQVIGSTVLDAVEANQVLTKTALVSANPSEGSGVPAGMRAITVHVLESGGVLALLRPGSRVDIQAVSERNGTAGEPHTAVRTILQNVEVLSTAAQPEQVALRFTAPYVTVLVRAEDSDLLAVADAGARVRLALRNRLDESGAARATVTLPSVFSGRPDGAPGPTATRNAAITRATGGIPLWARVVAVTERGARELSSSLTTPLDRNTLHVSKLPPPSEAESLLQQLESRQDLAVLSPARLLFTDGRPVPVAAGAGRRLSLSIHGGQHAGAERTVRVEPSLSWPEMHGVATRSLIADLPMPFDSGFLISGLSEGNAGPEILAGLSPGREAEHRQLMVIVTPRAARAALALATHAIRD